MENASDDWNKSNRDAEKSKNREMKIYAYEEKN